MFANIVPIILPLRLVRLGRLESDESCDLLGSLSHRGNPCRHRAGQRMISVSRRHHHPTEPLQKRTPTRSRTARRMCCASPNGTATTTTNHQNDPPQHVRAHTYTTGALAHILREMLGVCVLECAHANVSVCVLAQHTTAHLPNVCMCDFPAQLSTTRGGGGGNGGVVSGVGTVT